MTGREEFKKNKIIIKIFCKFLSIFTKSFQTKLLNGIFSFKNTKFQIAVRYCLLKNLSHSCGENVYISKYVVFKNLSNLTIGNNVSIHEFSYIDCGNNLTIGSNVSIAHSCSLIASNHSFRMTDIAFKYQPLSLGCIFIGDNVWIGCHTVILLGTRISSNVVIGAHSTCLSSLKYDICGLYAGSPAVFKKGLSK